MENQFSCVIPTPYEIVNLGALVIQKRRKDLLGLNTILPTQYHDSSLIVLHRPDILRGEQQWRGPSTNPPVVTDQYNRYGQYCTLTPGYWGEQWSINEAELAMVAEPGSCAGEPLNARNEVARWTNWLTYRGLIRMEHLIWQALLHGVYVAQNLAGQVVFKQFFNIRKGSFAVPWTDLTNSTPLANLADLAVMFRDTDAMFSGSGVRYYMNQRTLNVLFRNINPNDIGKGNISACCQVIDLDWINGALSARGLGKIVVYEGRWIDSNNGVNMFLPDGFVVVVGTRPDADYPGRYYLTRNLNQCLQMSGNERGMWYFYKDNCGEQMVRTITIGMGHNGGPVIEYPETVISLRVF